MPSDIPAARMILSAVSSELRHYGDHDAADRVDAALSLMTRDSPIRRTRTKSRRVDEPLVTRVRAIANGYGRLWSVQEIANAVGVNPGRVSEILKGQRP